MKYNEIISGTFIKRITRFTAIVKIFDRIELAHIKNTGRLQELLQKDAIIFLEVNNNPNRKTQYSIIAVYKQNRLVNIDSLAPNIVAYELIKNGQIPEIGNVNILKKEHSYGESRFDLYYEKALEQGFIEVKGVTLEKDGVAMFPDAPTSRGTKHVYELIKAKEAGYKTTILFLIQMQGCTSFTPNLSMDRKFTDALVYATQCGVEILVYDLLVTQSSLTLGNPVPFYVPEPKKAD